MISETLDPSEKIPKILAVDDEPAVERLLRQTFRRAIRQNKLELVFAENGRQALEALRAAPDIDLVLTDINMPGMDGLTLLSHLDEINPALKAVVVSAYGDMDNIRAAMNRGAFDFVTKPIELSDLEATVNKALQEIERYRALMRERDAAEQASRAKSDFVAMVSHEVRTPMNGVLGMARFLLETNLDPEQKEYVETILNSGKTLLSLLNDILDFSKIEAGKIELEEADFNLFDLTEGVVDLMAPRAVEKGLELVTYIDPARTPAMLNGDSARMHQILANLVGNAVKFTEHGSVSVTLSRMDARPGDDRIRLQFEVADTGIGIDADAQARLFQPFTQADASTTRLYGGTGLGLAICRRLVSIMGGEIGLKSERGSGSSFWFALPLAAADERSERSQPDLNGLRFAAAIDHVDLRTAVCGYLRAAGAEVLEFAGDRTKPLLEGETAADVDLILVDFSLDAPPRLATLERPADAPPALMLAPRGFGLRAQGPGGGAAFAGEIGKPVKRSALLRECALAVGREIPDREELPSFEEAWYEPPGLEDARAENAAVLVAENDPTNRKIVSKLLHRLGCAHTLTWDGEEALEALSGGGYGLLLTDCHMPVMDGYVLTERIRSGEPETKARLPIVALTADALSGTAERCRTAGMDRFLTKPIALAELGKVLGDLLPGVGALRRIASPPSIRPLAAASGERAGALGVRSETTVFDETNLRQTFGEINEDARGLARFFVETVDSEIDEIRTTLQEDRLSDARELVHTALGATMNVGATEMSAILVDVERALVDENGEIARRRWGEIGDAWARLKDAIDRL